MNTPKRLFQQVPGTAISIAYTVPAATTTILKNILMTNTTGANQSITVYLVPTGQAVGNQHKVISSYTIKPNDSISVDISAVLNASDTIQTSQGTANAINLYCSGVEMK